jgi:hypothetical protein
MSSNQGDWVMQRENRRPLLLRGFETHPRLYFPNSRFSVITEKGQALSER